MVRRVRNLLWCTSAILLGGASCTADYSVTDEPVGAHSLSQSKESEVELTIPYTSNKVGRELVDVFATHYLPSSKAGLRAIAQGQPPESVTPILSSKGDTLLYVVNYAPEGYVLLSARRDCTPVLAKSEKGHFSLSSGNQALMYWLEQSKTYVENSSTLPDSIKIANRLEWDLLALNKRKVSVEKLRSSDPYGLDEVVNLHLRTIRESEQQGYAVYTLEEFKRAIEFGSLSTLMPQSDLDEMLMNDRVYSCKRYGESLQALVLVRTNRVSISYDAKVPTSWGQTNGYNKYVPFYDEKNSHYRPVGCVATALGQIMYKHKSPVSYKWDKMKLAEPTDESASLLIKIAETNMRFGYRGSGTGLEDAISCLRKWGYETAREVGYRPDVLQGNLKEGLPILMGAEDFHEKNAKHAFVLDAYLHVKGYPEVRLLSLEDAPDGYIPTQYTESYRYAFPINGTYYQPNEDYYHLNMGWDGTGNGYYADAIYRGKPWGYSIKYSVEPRYIVDIKPKNK